MRRRAKQLALAPLLGAVALTVPAAAQQSGSAAVKDEAGDVRGKLDIRRVAIARGADGRLRAELTMAQSWTAADLRATAGASGSVCMRLYVRRDPDAEPPDYLVCASPRGTGDELQGRVLRDRSNGLPRPVEEAVVSRPTGRTIYLRFTQSGIGRPATVRFSGETTSRGARCPRPLGCRDLAPDAPDTVSLRLRSAG